MLCLCFGVTVCGISCSHSFAFPSPPPPLPRGKLIGRASARRRGQLFTRSSQTHRKRQVSGKLSWRPHSRARGLDDSKRLHRLVTSWHKSAGRRAFSESRKEEHAEATRTVVRLPRECVQAAYTLVIAQTNARNGRNANTHQIGTKINLHLYLREVMDSNCFYHILLYIIIILKGKWIRSQ